MKEITTLLLKEKEILLYPSPSVKETIPLALALFFSLTKLKKNANIYFEKFYEEFSFLLPSLEFIKFPRNFVIFLKIPKTAKITKVTYLKRENELFFRLRFKGGILKKENLSLFYDFEKPHLILALRATKEEVEKLSFLETVIVNIGGENGDLTYPLKKETLSSFVFKLIKKINKNPLDEKVIRALLSAVLFPNLSRKNLEKMVSFLERGGFSHFLNLE